MTETREQEQVRGAFSGIVIALAVVIAIFAFFALARADTLNGAPSADLVGVQAVNNGADNVIGT